MIPLETAIGAYERQPSTGYSSGVAVLATGLNLPLYLECTTAGTTSAGDITIPSSPSVGSTIADGTVVWTIRKLVNTSNTSGYVTKDVTNLTYYKKKVDTPAFNTRAEITTSGTWTAPVTGWYKITLKGGGAGGHGAFCYKPSSGNGYTISGMGGGEGGTTIEYFYLTSGTSVSIVIGAGGSGGTSKYSTSTSDTSTPGGDGGNTSVTIGSTTYTAYGAEQRKGGNGTIPGCDGGARNLNTDNLALYTAGGAGGGTKANISNSGGGGTGGSRDISVASSSMVNGNSGSDGYVWLEYWAE
jgi:hypothetical protein